MIGALDKVARAWFVVYNSSVALWLDGWARSTSHSNSLHSFIIFSPCPKNLLRRRKLSFKYKMKYLAILIATLAASILAQNNKNDK